MKKIITLLIAILYLAVSSGLAVEIHHCMGKVADISLLPSDSDECGKCGMPKGVNECCKDELKFVKLQDSHKLILADYKLSVPVTLINTEYYQLENNWFSDTRINDYCNHSPPNRSSISLLIKNCVFRI